MDGSVQSRGAGQGAGQGWGVRAYCHAYSRLFSGLDCTQQILPLATAGGLASSPFRSLCWRVLLNCLPSNPANWRAELAHSRSRYSAMQVDWRCAALLS